ncbi:hypothetical protein ACIBVL_03750 [Streptomyces sp. NPDC049687]|uniref:hypothetical protein n=1 Tax=Streptomyces sp. NPDC049687 TaxID=3365596 RepID=UPI00379415A0
MDPTGEGRLAVIDPEDIVRCAAVVLTEDGHVGKGHTLSGPEALTSREQVATIAEVTGQTIDFQDVTRGAGPQPWVSWATSSRPRRRRRAQPHPRSPFRP